MFSVIVDRVVSLLTKFPAYRLTSVLVAFVATMGAATLLTDRFQVGELSSLTSTETIPISIFVLMTVVVGFAAVLTLFTERVRTSDDMEREIANLVSSSTDPLPEALRRRPPSQRAKDIEKVYDNAVGVGYIATIFSRSRMNLKTELRKTRGAAGQALIFGIFFCFVAIGCTVYFIFTGSSAVSSSETSLYPFLIYYLPRLSVAVVAQIVALFF